MTKPNQGVILCGGLGTRLRPITETIPKPMIMCNGKPFLWYLLKQLHDQGIKRFLLLTGYLSEKIVDYGQWTGIGLITEWREDIKADVAISDENNLYISWAFFEEEILNQELGFLKKNSEFFGGSFDSTDSFVTHESNLIKRQMVSHLYSRKKTGYKFLYPDSWNETYHTIHYPNKVISRPEIEEYSEKGLFLEGLEMSYTYAPSPFGDTTTIDQKAHRIPLREIFINVNLIKEAFSNNSNVSEAIIEILDVLNEDSMNVYVFLAL